MKVFFEISGSAKRIDFCCNGMADSVLRGDFTFNEQNSVFVIDGKYHVNIPIRYCMFCGEKIKRIESGEATFK